METTEKKIFRKAFIGGFSKADVNNYITLSAQKYSDQIKELEEKYLNADKGREELSKKLREAEEKIEELLKEKAELDALKPKYEKLCLDNEEALLASAEKDEKIALLSERVASLEKIGEEYAVRKTELADIEISARARASEIIGDAESEASRKRSELDEELALRRRHFDEKKEAEIRAAGDSFAAVSRVIDSLKNEVDSMDSRITRIADTVRNNMSSLSDAVQTAQDKVAGIQSRLSGDE